MSDPFPDYLDAGDERALATMEAEMLRVAGEAVGGGPDRVRAVLDAAKSLPAAEKADYQRRLMDHRSVAGAMRELAQRVPALAGVQPAGSLVEYLDLTTKAAGGDQAALKRIEATPPDRIAKWHALT